MEAVKYYVGRKIKSLILGGSADYKHNMLWLFVGQSALGYLEGYILANYIPI